MTELVCAAFDTAAAAPAVTGILNQHGPVEIEERALQSKPR